MQPHDHNEESFSDGVPLPPEPVDELSPGKEGKGPTQAQVLVQMAEDTYRLVRSDDGRTYAVPKLGPNIAVPLGSKSGVRAKLAASLFRRSGQVASGSALSDCINVLEGEAGELDPMPVFLRMGRHTDPDTGCESVVVDMGTETGHAIVIDAEGWRVEPCSPVIFRRSKLQHPLVEPLRAGSLDGLRALINLSEEDFRLAVGWAVAAYLTDIPHPILFVQGEQGTAKSNLVRCLLALVDPQPADDREAPANHREWAIFALASWAFCFDNVTDIPDWLSNSLCKGVTGDSVLQRALHSDEDIVVFSFQRVMAITTIGVRHVLASDLADRILLIEPEIIDEADRLPESQVRAAREAALSSALGAVLELVAAVLKTLPDVQVERLPRMADFARVLAALDQVTGWATLATYREKISAMSVALIEGNTFAQALYLFAARHQAAPWEGTSGELLTALRSVCVDQGMPVGELPTDVRVAGRKIRELAPPLRKVGIDIRPLDRTNKRRAFRISKITRNDDGR